MLTLEIFKKWLDSLADVYARNKDHLTGLDSAIGDADHGVNMARGFAAVKEMMGKTGPSDIPSLFKAASMTLIKTVGGASGPLYGTLFMKAGPLLKDSPVSLSVLASAFEAGVEGVKKLGKSGPGEKTMLDAWIPAVEALRSSSRDGGKNGLAKAAAAARRGAEATVPMLAIKGRASYLGERSIGHQDPGAASTAMMLEALSEAAGSLGNL